MTIIAFFGTVLREALLAGHGDSGRRERNGARPVHPLAPQGGARPSRGTLGAVEVHIPLPWSGASQQ